MKYGYYHSPLGLVEFGFLDQGLKYLSFEDQISNKEEVNHNIYQKTVHWLDDYFINRTIDPLPPLAIDGSAFALKVYEAIAKIPMGEVRSYKEVGMMIGSKGYRAVGHALNRNPLPLMIPCHRIIGTNGHPGGYAYGLDLKFALLQHEGYDIDRLRK